jgi:hypothetical protein
MVDPALVFSTGTERTTQVSAELTATSALV